VSQFSLFGAAAADPSLDDLDGVLLAGGHWVRSAGLARLSVVVGHRWRADALAAEFGLRSLRGPDVVVPAEDGWSVRTAFTADLVPAAARWSHGANEGPPTGLAVTAAGLRLWTMAAGYQDEAGYLLGTARPDARYQTERHYEIHAAAGAQLSRLGLAAVSIGIRGGGPGWRLTSAKRLRRLAELIGPAPEGAGADWPGLRQ
jgi:hypothetical protein